MKSPKFGARQFIEGQVFLMIFFWPYYLIIFFEVLISYHFKTRSLTNTQSSERASIVLTDEEEDEGSWFDSSAWALSEWSLHVHPAPVWLLRLLSQSKDMHTVLNLLHLYMLPCDRLAALGVLYPALSLHQLGLATAWDKKMD